MGSRSSPAEPAGIESRPFRTAASWLRRRLQGNVIGLRNRTPDGAAGYAVDIIRFQTRCQVSQDIVRTRRQISGISPPRNGLQANASLSASSPSCSPHLHASLRSRTFQREPALRPSSVVRAKTREVRFPTLTQRNISFQLFRSTRFSRASCPSWIHPVHWSREARAPGRSDIRSTEGTAGVKMLVPVRRKRQVSQEAALPTFNK